MGEIRVEIQLESEGDRCLHEAGKLKKGKIRRALITAIVDTGAVMTLLPRELAERLGLRKIDVVTVCLADDRKVEMDKVGPLSLTVAQRTMITDCLVGPLGCEPLVGQIVMEELDLICDPRRRTLTPRPESPFQPTLKMKRAGAAADSR